MFARQKNNKKCSIALDIGTHICKLIEVESDNGSHTLTKLNIKELPSEQNENTLYACLKSLFEETPLASRDIRISLSGHNALVRIVTMPDMGGSDLKNALKFEADRYIPFSIDDVSIDAYVLGKERENPGQMKVIIAASKKELIAKRLELFKKLGLNITLIDMDSFALFNAFTFTNTQIEDTQIYGILNMGHSHVNMLISQGLRPMFTRDIHIGGQHIMGAISKSNPEIKSLENLGSSKSDLEPAFMKLVDEIKISLAYYENQYGKTVECIYSTGGLSGVGLLEDLIKEKLGVKILKWDPLSRFQIGEMIKKDMLEKYKSSLSICVGMSIREDVV